MYSLIVVIFLKSPICNYKCNNLVDQGSSIGVKIIRWNIVSEHYFHGNKIAFMINYEFQRQKCTFIIYLLWLLLLKMYLYNGVIWWPPLWVIKISLTNSAATWPYVSPNMMGKHSTHNVFFVQMLNLCLIKAVNLTSSRTSREGKELKDIQIPIRQT